MSNEIELRKSRAMLRRRRISGSDLKFSSICSSVRVMVSEPAVATVALPISSMMIGKPADAPIKVCTTGRQNAPRFSPEALSIWKAR